MPRPRFEKLARDRQKAILAAAAREFAEKGYSGASMNRIIERAGISKGAMYYYFNDKEDLFLAVVLDVQEEVFRAIGDFPEVKSPAEFWGASEDFFRRMLAFAAANPVLAGLVKSWNAAVARKELSRSVREYQKPHFDFHRSYAALGQKVGAVRTDLPDDLLFPLLEAIDEAGDLWIASHFEEFTTADWERAHRTFCGLYRRLLSPGPESMEVSL